ncbi:MAG: hypothetical protein HDR74_03755 [Bacteroides sp.]|nr:hypothetical protein [Bacteroidales bacterium]MBD5378992.1 hypothetical protein [Bacteroides sp.]
MEAIVNFYNSQPQPVTNIIIGLVVLVFLIWLIAKLCSGQATTANPDNTISKKTSDNIDRISSSVNEVKDVLRLYQLLMPQLLTARTQHTLADDISLTTKVAPSPDAEAPKRLNRNGNIVTEKFELEDFFHSNKNWLILQVEKFNPKTALDVEMCSMAALRIASDDDRFIDLKYAIYNSPALDLYASEFISKKVEITLEDVLYVLSIQLRDAYFDKHRVLK